MSRSPAAAGPLAPLIVVMGATGTGKSQLAVDLAHRFNGEIINGDAMQLYDGLPITTNKMPNAERRGIPHHLLGCIDLSEQPWTVDRYVPRALQAMDEIRARGKLPVLVGGTHYYTQALLFRDALVNTSTTAEDASEATATATASTSGKDPILDAPTEQLLAKLREVDPVMADRWHPNDRRKIRRSLEIYLHTGQRASDVYDAQTQAAPGLGLRFRTLLFWTHATKEILSARLDARVDHMVADGLLAEAASVHALQTQLHAQGTPVDLTRGIWVAIGYKEFLPYLEAKAKARPEQHERELTALYDEGISRTQIHTRQYASYQIKWIRNKLLPSLSATHRAHSSTYILDASDLTRWDDAVLAPAADITKTFLEDASGALLPDPVSMGGAVAEMLVAKQESEVWMRRSCEVCGVVTVSEREWEVHVSSRRHKNRVRKVDGRVKAEDALAQAAPRDGSSDG